MNNTKSPKNVSLKNQLELWLFCALIGAVAGALVWILLKIMAVGTEFLWKWFPGKTSVPYYTILICVAGAAIIGIFRKIFGDYPEDLETVMEKVRVEKRYEYKNMLVMMVAALLPLLIGSSVGPEAGLTGIIVGLCYWAGDNLKFAKQNTRNYSQIGAAVSMSVLFHAPLFGIFEVEENSEEDLAALTKGSKLFIYGIALAAGTSIYAGLSALFGAGLSGFPSFDMVEIQRKDYLLMILYILCGLILELVDDRDFFVGSGLRRHLLVIDDDTGMENLLLDFLTEVVRHAAHECTLREVGNLGSGYQGIQLRVDGGGCVLPVDGYGLPLLKDFAETLRKVLCRFAYHLSGENIADCILDHFRLFFTVVTGQLREVLEAETYRHLVASGGGYQVVDAAEIDGR